MSYEYQPTDPLSLRERAGVRVIDLVSLALCRIVKGTWDCESFPPASCVTIIERCQRKRTERPDILFSEFGRPKADLNVRANRNALQPGDELEARVELLPREDFHVRLGTVELVRLETYIQTVRHQYGVSYHKRTHADIVASETFMENQTVRRLGGSSTNARFVLPQDAIPTLSGSIFQKIQPGISWEIRALLDVTRARDMRQSQELKVARPPVSDDQPPRPVAAETGHRQCNLALELSQGEAQSGDTLNGALRAEMLDSVEAAEVRIELVRVEKVRQRGTGPRRGQGCLRTRCHAAVRRQP